MEPDPAAPEEAAPATRSPSFVTWLREGMRAGLLLRPRLANAEPTPLQILLLVALAALIDVGLGRFEVAGDATFDLRGWLGPWWSSAALLLIAWWGLQRRQSAAATLSAAGVAAWFALWMAALLPANLVSQLLSIAQAREALPESFTGSEWATWGVYFGLWGWTAAVVVKLFFHFGARGLRLACMGIAAIALFAVTAWQFPDRAWQGEQAKAAEAGEKLQLSQAIIESQQDILRRSLGELAPQREGVIDVYGLVFSPYAEGDVFLRESSMVKDVLAERFDARDRVIQLANHATTAENIAWATPENLERAIDAIGAKMDRENDVIVIYLTSHGARDYKLAAANPPLDVDPVSPGDLRRALDKAGIRNRVIAVSACYSGGWVGPLESETTLVMTAADADHTSYGCGRLSQLTFFGRALFDEQLRKTHSFEQAFAAAVPLIKQREIEGNKPDGFSNPQISVGSRIAPVLRELEQRLDVLAHDK